MCIRDSFNGDRLVFTNQPESKFMVMIGTSFPHFPVQDSNLQSRFIPIVGAFLLTGQRLLCTSQLPFLRTQPTRVGDLLPATVRRGDGSKIIQPHINASHFLYGGEWCGGNVDNERHIKPSVGFTNQRHRCWLRWQKPGQCKTDVAYLGQPHVTDTMGCLSQFETSVLGEFGCLSVVAA